jgi:DNA-binding transcriptional LysR family regulator
MDRLETRELTYFITVAEELHFGRAAERIGIAQPPLSRAVARLERRMGVRLFERTSRRVSLTPAGTVFLNESRKALAAVDTAVRRAQSAARPERLKVAARPGTGSGLLADVISAYRQQPDAVDTDIVFTYDQAGALHDGTADVALMCGNGDVKDLEFMELAPERPIALLPADHHLATRATVTIAELWKEDAFSAQCPPEPLDMIVDRVALGHLLVVVGESVTERLGRSITAIPVLDFPSTVLVLSWRPHTPFAARTQFVHTAKIVATRLLQEKQAF